MKLFYSALALAILLPSISMAQDIHLNASNDFAVLVDKEGKTAELNAQPDLKLSATVTVINKQKKLSELSDIAVTMNGNRYRILKGSISEGALCEQFSPGSHEQSEAKFKPIGNNLAASLDGNSDVEMLYAAKTASSDNEYFVSVQCGKEEYIDSDLNNKIFK